MVDTNPELKEVDWRPPEWGDDEDPIELQLKGYDFKALHDRIMQALEISSPQKKSAPKKERMS